MKKFGFFLLLIMVLLSGFNTLLSAHGYRDCRQPASSQLPQTSEGTTVESESPILIIERAASDRERHVFKIHPEREAEEEERDDDESFSLKRKNSDSSTLAAVIFAAQWRVSFGAIKESQPSGELVFNTSSTKRYLVFQAIRI